MIAFEELKAIHLELSNAACPQCARNDYGGAANPRLPLAELSLADIRRMLPGDLVRRRPGNDQREAAFPAGDP